MMTRDEAFRIIDATSRSTFICAERDKAVRMAWAVLAEIAKPAPTPLGDIRRFGPNTMLFPVDLDMACGAILKAQRINKDQVKPEVWHVIPHLHAQACRMANEIAAYRGLGPVFDDQGHIIKHSMAPK